MPPVDKNPTPVTATPESSRAGRPGEAGEIFIARQPILNSDQQLVAYELLFRASGTAGSAGVIDGVHATSRLLINTFNNFGVEKVLGNKKAFINVPAALLESDILELLPPERVVIEILEDVEPTPDVISRCKALKARGFQFALDDFVYRPELEPLILIASYIKLDLLALGIPALGEQARRLRGRGISLLAEKVETRTDYDACRALLINHYQGYFFAKPETLRMRRMDPSTHQLMQLFNLVNSNAATQQIEAGFRQDVALSYNLLRYINSVGFGLLTKVENIKHALVVLGHAKLARWLTLLLFSQNSHNPAPQALFRTALVRARLVELLGQQRLPAKDSDLLFSCGMFSLLDAMLDTPLDEALKPLNLPDRMLAALLRNEGPYAPFLALGRACELGDPDQLRAMAAPLGFSLTDMNRLQLDAIAWTDEIAAIGGN